MFSLSLCVVSGREQVDSYNELDAKLAMKEYDANNSSNSSISSISSISSNSPEKMSKSDSLEKGTRSDQGAQEQSQSEKATTEGVSREATVEGDMKSKYKPARDHRTKKLFKASSKKIQESDYANN